MINNFLHECCARKRLIERLFLQLTIAHVLTSQLFMGSAIANSKSEDEIRLTKTIIVLERRDKQEQANYNRLEVPAINADQLEFGPVLTGIQHGNELVSQSQFDDSINNKHKQIDVSLYELANNSQNDVSNIPTAPVDELSQEFLSLFDELWRIKNTSAAALVWLEYSNQFSQNDSTPKQDNCILEGNCQTDQWQNSRPNRHSVSYSTLNLTNRTKQNWNKGLGSLQKTTTPNGPINLAEVATKINGWLWRVHQKVQHLIAQMYAALANKIATHKANVRPARTRVTNDYDNDSDNSDKLLPRRLGGQPLERDVARLFKRQTDLHQATNEKQTFSGTQRVLPNQIKNGNGSESCTNLTIDEEERCATTETLVNSSLNHSFPGTLVAIENNCRHITFLLSSCWPQQLQQIRASLASWNETLLSLTEFPLLIGNNRQQQSIDSTAKPLPSSNQQYPARGPLVTAQDAELISCRIEPKSPQFIRDRASWMWLNLCLDRRFRQDYVDNLRCLSLWNQERAQQVCSNEYRRMQTYLASQTEVNNVAGLESGQYGQRMRGDTKRDHEPYHDHPHSHDQAHPVTDQSASQTSGSTNSMGRLDKAPSDTNTEREIGSKMLCCMFDQFLRCVNRQAVRDCGRMGAQFVINFMSRIGTDDMKYLCNAESRTSGGTGNRAGKPGAGNRRNNNYQHDRSPFIENNYCSDPKIQNTLFGALGGPNYGDRGRHPNSNTGLRQSNHPGGRGKSRNPSNINPDPTFFGSDTISESSSSSSCDLVVRNGLLPLLSVLIWNRITLDFFLVRNS